MTAWFHRRWPGETGGVLSRCFLLVLVWAVSSFAESGPKRIYFAPDDHTDYLWSADEETYRQAFIEMIDYYLDLADATEKNPPEHQSRWNCDGSLWMWTYEKNKTAAEFERFIRRIRDGHISVPLNALVSTYGATPLEAVLRGMYYPGQIERRFGLHFPIAIAMEDQTLPFGLGALWAGAGAKYSWKGICGCDTVMEKIKTERRPHEVYWWRGLDGSRILMKWNTYFEKTIGGYAEAQGDPAAALALVESNPRFTSIYPFRVIGIFGKGEDHLKTLTDEFVTLAAAKTDAKRKVIVSNQLDFFQDFEATYGRDLPSFSASFGNEWDLYSASMAEVSARVRRAVERLRGAEALATLVSLKRPEFLNGRQSAREQAWMNLGLYWEHDWTSDSNILQRETRAAWQRKVAREIESYVDSLGADAAYALGRLIEKKGNNLRFYVFNPLSWARTDVVDLPYGWSMENDVANDGKGPVRVIDLSTGLEAPSQLVRLNSHEYVKGRQHLRVQVKDVPPLGYKVFEVREGAGESFSGRPAISGDFIENAAYKIKVAPRGAVTGLVDKTQGNREFASVVGGRAINDFGPGSGTLEVENSGPVSVTMKATAVAPVPHTTRITLFRDSRRIELHNEITQNFADAQSWGFGFNLRSPDVWHEEVGAVIRARLLADGGHYSPTNSRLDWLTLNHFAAMSGEGGAGVMLSNADCAFMKLGASAMVDGVSQLDVTTPLISVLAGGQVDGPKLGIPQQGGDSFFTQRFALEAYSAFQATDAMKFALEHQNPLLAGIVTGGSAYPEKSYSLLTISDPNVLLWALKPAEEGIDKGIIARVWNLSSDSRRFSLSLASGISSAQRVTHIETDIEAASVSGGALSATTAPSQLLTFRLFPGSVAGKGPATAKIQKVK